MRLFLPALCLALAACGQSGALYLPDTQPAPPPAASASPPQQAPREDTPEEDESPTTAPAPSTP